MTYVDGFVIPVPTARKNDYRRMCREAADMFIEYGASRIVETWSDDVPEGKLTDFRRAVKAEAGEAIVFSWIIWPSKAVRDAGNAKIMADPRMQPGPDMPFDPKRMIFGGFEPLFDSDATPDDA